jgi:hypothetical protein
MVSDLVSNFKFNLRDLNNKIKMIWESFRPQTNRTMKFKDFSSLSYSINSLFYFLVSRRSSDNDFQISLIPLYFLEFWDLLFDDGFCNVFRDKWIIFWFIWAKNFIWTQTWEIKNKAWIKASLLLDLNFSQIHSKYFVSIVINFNDQTFFH